MVNLRNPDHDVVPHRIRDPTDVVRVTCNNGRRGEMFVLAGQQTSVEYCPFCGNDIVVEDDEDFRWF